ncbi:hypothetical protein Tco_0246972 [Tanacetum coccineum]
MYLIGSRPDIMFVVCACARFQVTPKVSHLHAMKRIFRYLKGQPKLGLWYTKDSPFNLEAYTDSDYAGASLDRKSTTGGAMDSKLNAGFWIQFHKYQIFIDNESTICVVKNPVFHLKTKHIKIRHHFIRDSYEKRLIQVIKIHNQNIADFLTKAFDVVANDEIQVSAVGRTYYGKQGSTARFSSFTTLNVADGAASTGVDVRLGGATTTVTGLEAGQGSGNIDKTPTMPHDSPLLRVNTLGSDEGKLINQRKRHFTQQRAEERRNKPPIQAQQRTYMSNYIKYMGSYTLQQLRGYSFDEIKSLFKATMKRVNTFTPMESDVDRTVPKIAVRSSKRDAEEKLGQESSKRQKIGESSQQAKQPRDKEPDELSILKALGSTRRSSKLEITLRESNKHLHPGRKGISIAKRSSYIDAGSKTLEVTPDAVDNYGLIFDAEPLQKVQNDNDNYNVFDNDQEHHEQPESINEPYPVEKDKHNIIIDSLDMSYDKE